MAERAQSYFKKATYIDTSLFDVQMMQSSMKMV